MNDLKAIDELIAALGEHTTVRVVSDSFAQEMVETTLGQFRADLMDLDWDTEGCRAMPYRTDGVVMVDEQGNPALIVQQECAYCQAIVWESEVPPKWDDDAWAELGRYHQPDCEWITTRAHRLTQLMTTAEVAIELGISPRRVRALIAAEDLPASKVGRDWLIDPVDLELVRERRPGRPRSS